MDRPEHRLRPDNGASIDLVGRKKGCQNRALPPNGNEQCTHERSPYSCCHSSQRQRKPQRADPGKYESHRLDKSVSAQYQLTDIVRDQAILRHCRQHPAARGQDYLPDDRECRQVRQRLWVLSNYTRRERKHMAPKIDASKRERRQLVEAGSQAMR